MTLEEFKAELERLIRRARAGRNIPLKDLAEAVGVETETLDMLVADGEEM